MEAPSPELRWTQEKLDCHHANSVGLSPSPPAYRELFSLSLAPSPSLLPPARSLLPRVLSPLYFTSLLCCLPSSQPFDLHFPSLPNRLCSTRFSVPFRTLHLRSPLSSTHLAAASLPRRRFTIETSPRASKGDAYLILSIFLGRNLA